MKWCTLFLLVFLTGCGEYVTPAAIKKAERMCSINDGLLTLHYTTMSSLVTLRCNNGAYYRLNESELNEE